ncbi:MAG: hypothetical protein ABI591_10555 [Kofleriaceae bacterium]
MVFVACSDRHEPTPAAGNPAGSGSSAAAVAPGPTGPIADDYRADIDNLCDVLKRSGADQLTPGEQQPVIAMWLGPNIKTTAGHNFLVTIAPLQGAAKAEALESEAKRVGIASCPLAAEWRKPGAVNRP